MQTRSIRWRHLDLHELVIVEPYAPDMDPVQLVSPVPNMLARYSVDSQSVRPGQVLQVLDLFVPYGVCADCEHTKKHPS